MLKPTPSEVAARDSVVQALLSAIRQERAIRLPKFDPSTEEPGSEFALQRVGVEPNPYGGRVGAYRYQFEGEEDLLHLVVLHLDESPITAEEGRELASWLLPAISSALVWMKPAPRSCHFYVGHDDLLAAADPQ